MDGESIRDYYRSLSHIFQKLQNSCIQEGHQRSYSPPLMFPKHPKGPMYFGPNDTYRDYFKAEVYEIWVWSRRVPSVLRGPGISNHRYPSGVRGRGAGG